MVFAENKQNTQALRTGFLESYHIHTCVWNEMHGQASTLKVRKINDEDEEKFDDSFHAKGSTLSLLKILKLVATQTT